MTTKTLISNLLKSSTSTREGELLKALLSFYTENESESTHFQGTLQDMQKKNSIRDIKISNLQNSIDNLKTDIAYYTFTESTTQSVSNKVNYITIDNPETEGSNIAIELHLPTYADDGETCDIVFNDVRTDTTGVVTTSIYVTDNKHISPTSLKSIVKFIYLNGEWLDIDRHTISVLQTSSTEAS